MVGEVGGEGVVWVVLFGVFGWLLGLRMSFAWGMEMGESGWVCCEGKV